LLNNRSAIRKRRHHIFSKPRKTPRKVVKFSAERATSQISILHVEDNALVAKVVDEMFATEEWRVELCMDGDSALRKLTGNDHYDLLVELVQRARKMTHHRRTPIVMLSGSDCETKAWGAGVDAFLKKPEQISELPLTIARLLEDGPEYA